VTGHEPPSGIDLIDGGAELAATPDQLTSKVSR
jgi:hypothetical protein